MKIHQFYTDSSKWCKHLCYLDKYGQSCDKEDAESCCLAGAIAICYGAEKCLVFGELIQTSLNIKDFTAWNDAPERTFEEVKELVLKLDI